MRERLGLLLLAAFVALDIVLVSLALRHTSGPAPSSDVSSSGSASAAPSSAAPRPSKKPAATASTSAAGERGPLLLGLADDGTVVRATRGSCSAEEAASVEVSRAAGRRLRVSEVDGLTQVLAVDIPSGDDVRVVGLDGECALTTYTSSDRGQEWSAEADAVGQWHRPVLPRRESVGTPDGTKPAPCAPTAVSTFSTSSARVLCADGAVHGTSDTGSTWVRLGSLPGAVAIAFTSPSAGWGLTSREDCPAAVVRTTDGGQDWDQVACVEGGEPRALAARGDLVVAQAGATLSRSTDDGASFAPVG